MNLGPLIPLAGILSGVAIMWICLRYRQLTLEHRRTELEFGAQGEEKKRLEQRLAVLERIVTDRGIETADQIEALRERDAEQVR
jgi:hypothetical protein